ncbi:MAG: family 10 glycosylhydrolase [Chloroflexi bacterium]|nr:family 10 glycosylhydrolase [Chloroflexota bacterium]
MVRFGVLVVGCLTFLGLAFLAAGPLHASTPPLATPVLVSPSATAARPIPVVTSAGATVTPYPTSVGLAGAGPVPLVPAPTLQSLDAPELRAVWVDAFHDGFKTPQQVDTLVAWARAANLNALFVQVRRRGDAYYLSSLEPRAEDPDLAPGFDALQYLIDKAHQGPQRLQVHAWLATLPIWYMRTPPLAPNHAFNTHGLTANPADSWLMSRDDGETWAGDDNGGTYYLDPGDPAVQAYTTDVFVNLVRNYGVDGVHLDQVRYYEGEPLRWGYNPTSVARFNAQFNRDPATQPDPTDPDWIAWRRDQVSALVRRIYTQVKAIKPDVAVTAAVVTWGRGPVTDADWQKQAAYAAVLQDWRTWLQQGIVDYLLPMDYFREGTEQAGWFDTWTQWQVTYANRRGVVLGLGSYLNSQDGVLAQLSRARALGPLGVALYSYAVPDADLENASADDRLAFAAQLRSIFTRPAPVPTLGPALVASAGP